MTIAFVSNFYNHHQDPFSRKMFEKLGNDYVFISTERMSADRLAMGWGDENEPEYVLHFEEEPERCTDIINNCDVVITGSAPYCLIKKRLKSGKLTFQYSERVFKKKPVWFKMLKYKWQYFHWFGRFKNFYLLCSSGFTYYDYYRTFSHRNRAYKWGYFPKTNILKNPLETIGSKNSEPVSLLFVSRMINWKHPELPIMVAKRLQEEGVNFKLTMIGNGILKHKIEELVNEHNLNDNVEIIDHLKPKEVRGYMLKSNIFLFTSDRNEGWGAVLNEAMNSCCGVVASSAIGAVPYLLENNKNGYIYQDGDFDDLYNKVKDLIFNKEKREKFGFEAYQTILTEWNEDVAANNLIELINDINEKRNSIRFKSGPCSKAEIIKDNWFSEK